jgi:2-aminoadipate transaminase
MKATALSALARRTTEPPISWLMRLTLDHPKLISLAAGFTDNATLPVAEARRLVADVLGKRKSGQAALQYGSTAGDPLLRRITAQNVQTLDTGRQAHGEPLPAYQPDHVLITHGSQQLLYLSVEALCDPGDIVLVEDPTYFVFLGILQSHGVRARGIRMEDDGLELDHLDAVLAGLQRRGELQRVKVLYLVTYHQNPTGITTSLEKKRVALEILRHYERAAGHPLYLIEDAAYRELRFTGEDTPSALTVRGAAPRVIYAGTYSKPFATGIRIGFGLLPEPVLSAARRIKGNHDFGTANFLQQLLARALTSGRYEQHLATLRARYAAKAGWMLGALEQHFPDDAEWVDPGGGLYVWVSLPRRRRTGTASEIFRRALRRDVLYVPGALCYADDPTRHKPDHELRLSFGNASRTEILEGVRRLGAVLERTA